MSISGTVGTHQTTSEFATPVKVIVTKISKIRCKGQVPEVVLVAGHIALRRFPDGNGRIRLIWDPKASSVAVDSDMFQALSFSPKRDEPVAENMGAWAVEGSFGRRDKVEISREEMIAALSRLGCK